MNQTMNTTSLLFLPGKFWTTLGLFVKVFVDIKHLEHLRLFSLIIWYNQIIEHKINHYKLNCEKLNIFVMKNYCIDLLLFVKYFTNVSSYFIIIN